MEYHFQNHLPIIVVYPACLHFIIIRNLMFMYIINYIYRHKQSYNLHPDARWNIRPSAPIYVPSDDNRSIRVPTPQNLPHSASHTHSIASMHSYRNNLDPNDYQNMNSQRSRSPSCKMAAPIDWGVLANPIGTGAWKVRAGLYCKRLLV